mmetsp:Transcript_36731/g.77073  ORF Transcript_36731/g.77073 Transcript_36731/m.77073 type:complete len:325 (-) Transcript_36731:210-1184(-)
MAHLSPIIPAWESTILVLILLAAINIAVIEALSTPTSATKILRVCQSPGCKDDGAISTLEFLSAVAPPGVDVVKGGCVSLCGSGPVVELCDDIDSMAPIKKKRVKGRDVILSLLDECSSKGDEGEEIEPALKPYMRDRLVSGYELSLEAHQAYASKDYQSAVDLYTDAIESGRKPAMILQEARSAIISDTTTDDNEQSYGYPEGVRWLVTSFKNSCRSRLSLNDVDGARRDAFAATVFSQNCDGDAHECLAEVCASSGDTLGEWQAVKSAISQYERMEEEYSKPLPGADAPARAAAVKKRSHATARKRELGFRVAKLERELRAS